MTTQQTFSSDEAILNGGTDTPANDGRIAPQDGNANTVGAWHAVPLQLTEPDTAHPFGLNNERLEEMRPDLVNALRELEVQYRQEGIVARRHEIRRIRQARLFWQGLQYAWWNPQDMTWHLPYESKSYDDAAMAEMPRYQFVTNIYQAFGLSFVSVLSQDVPATRFYPQSAQSIADVITAKAASQVSTLIEQNNRVQHLLTGVAFYLWTDGKIGGYVRYVADAQRFGSHDEPVIEEHYVPLGEDTYACPECGAEQGLVAQGLVAQGLVAQGLVAHGLVAQGLVAQGLVAQGLVAQGLVAQGLVAQGLVAQASACAGLDGGEDGGSGAHVGAGIGSSSGNAFGNYGGSAGISASGDTKSRQAEACPTEMLPPVLCRKCGASLGPEHFKPAERVAVPVVTEIRRVANGQEVISVVGGLELNTPVWANEMHEYPYLQWSMEVHRAKLKASYPLAADKIQMGGPQSADEIYARSTRVAISQGDR